MTEMTEPKEDAFTEMVMYIIDMTIKKRLKWKDEYFETAGYRCIYTKDNVEDIRVYVVPSKNRIEIHSGKNCVAYRSEKAVNLILSTIDEIHEREILKSFRNAQYDNVSYTPTSPSGWLCKWFKDVFNWG